MVSFGALNPIRDSQGSPESKPAGLGSKPNFSSVNRISAIQPRNESLAKPIIAAPTGTKPAIGGRTLKPSLSNPPAGGQLNALTFGSQASLGDIL